MEPGEDLPEALPPDEAAQLLQRSPVPDDDGQDADPQLYGTAVDGAALTDGDLPW